MNLASQSSEGANAGGCFVNFNQDCTSLSVGSETGYRLFSLVADDGLEEIYFSKGGEDTYLVERLFSSSLVAVVTLAAPRKLKVCHFNRGTEICNYSYSNTILAVKLNRSRLIVCLEESLYIHNIRDMKVLHTIRDTPPNPRGLCSLSAHTDNCFLAYPGSSSIGEVQIFDAIHLHAKTMIPAHDSPLAALAFNCSGTRVATASERGTVIRIFSVKDGTRLFEFRRGVKRCVSISSLVFSMCSNFVCCSSNTETVHVFKLVEPAKEMPRQSADESWMGYLSKAVSVGANYLPAQVTDVFSQGRAFASVHLPVSGVKNVCAITTISKMLRLLVASAEGILYMYSLDAVEGGNCTLVKQHLIAGAGLPIAPSKPATPLNIATGGGKTSPAYLIIVEGGNSYAGALRGRNPDTMSGTDSEKFHEMSSAAESPPRGGFKFDDDKEFPPVTQGSE